MLTFEPEAHVYAWNGKRIPSVTQVLDRLHDFSHVPMEVLEAAKTRGSNVHSACQFFDEGDLDESSLEPSELGYVQAWQRFCAEHHPNWSMIETPLYHPVFCYAGTPDRIGSILSGGVRIDAQVDIKTSASSHPVWGVQTAAYNAAANFTGRRFTCQLRANGTYKLIEWSDPTDWPVFLSLINLSNWTRKHNL